jgi:8-oxo-dGTP pyrophosphatase MutT (NUDIX family)
MNCNNCGKTGHIFNQCRMPVTSYGIIAYCKTESDIKFMMIRRKDSFGFIDFIRGKYSATNMYQIQKSVDEMSVGEKARILSEPFKKLWTDMWGAANAPYFRNEERESAIKFEMIIAGENVGGITLRDIVARSKTNWSETEWEFPKGRRDAKEKDVDCAQREFEEETGLSKTRMRIIENVSPYEETFIGTNHVSYKHKYFLGVMSDESCPMTTFQKTEVSKMEWKTMQECLECMRPYNLEKKRIISNIDTLLREYVIA